MQKTVYALLMGLFLTQSLALPACAGFFDFKLGGDKKEEGQPSGSAGPEGAKGEAKELKNATSPMAPWPSRSRRTSSSSTCCNTACPPLPA